MACTTSRYNIYEIERRKKSILFWKKNEIKEEEPKQMAIATENGLACGDNDDNIKNNINNKNITKTTVAMNRLTRIQLQSQLTQH